MLEEILGNHQFNAFGQDHVFYSNTENDTLFVSFAGDIEYYVCVTWFYQQSEFGANFLFLKDVAGSHATYSDPCFEELIQSYIDKYNIKNVIMFGPSMGGVAAISYGIRFNARMVISIDPQPIGDNYDYHELLGQIESTSFYYNTRFFISYTFIDDWKLPVHTQDIVNELQKKNVLLMLQPSRSQRHLGYIPSKEFLLDILRQYSQITVSRYTKWSDWM